jgi:hypothetical protein
LGLQAALCTVVDVPCHQEEVDLLGLSQLQQVLPGLAGSPTAAFSQPRLQSLEALEGAVQVQIGAVQVLQVHLAVDLAAG